MSTVYSPSLLYPRIPVRPYRIGSLWLVDSRSNARPSGYIGRIQSLPICNSPMHLTSNRPKYGIQSTEWCRVHDFRPWFSILQKLQHPLQRKSPLRIESVKIWSKGPWMVLSEEWKKKGQSLGWLAFLAQQPFSSHLERILLPWNCTYEKDGGLLSQFERDSWKHRVKRHVW
jgi:hypothetical protein